MELKNDVDLDLNMFSLNVTNPDLHHVTWSDKYGNVRYFNYTYSTYYSAERVVWNPIPVRYFVANFWHYSVWIAAIYVVAVFALQRWMAKREPYNLRRLLFTWNLSLAVFSAFGFWRVSEEFFYVLREHGFKESVCRTFDLDGPSAFWSFLFAVSKVFELVDTLFLILRKRPVIFLHWYHHAAVLVYCWHAARELTAASRWFIGMNYGVHAIMYAYYAATSIGVRLPRPFSMSITLLQTSQMFVGVAISSYIAALKYRHYKEVDASGVGRNNVSASPDSVFVCQHSDENLFLCFAIYASFAVLFMNFLRATYFSTDRKRDIKASNIKKKLL